MTTDYNPLICFCFNIHQQEILEVLQRPGVNTIFDLMAQCKAGNGCTSCWPGLEELIARKSP